MRTFLFALLAVGAIAVASDYILGGPVTGSEGILINTSAAAANVSPNVRLPGQDEAEEETAAEEQPATE